MNLLIEKMGIPQNCLSNKTIFKKLFLESGMLDITDKKALKDDINKIRITHSIEASTINIKPYIDEEREYVRIPIIEVELNSNKRVKRIASFINKSIFDSLIIIFTHGDMIALSVADKRINQADKSKWVVEYGWITHWFNPSSPTKSEQKFMADLSLKNLSFLNFYAFYTDVKNCVIALNSARRSGTYSITTKEQTDTRLESLRKIDELENEIAQLRASLKKEKQFNTKLKLNVAVKECQDAIVQLEQKL